MLSFLLRNLSFIFKVCLVTHKNWIGGIKAISLTVSHQGLERTYGRHVCLEVTVFHLNHLRPVRFYLLKGTPIRYTESGYQFVIFLWQTNL